MEYSINKLSKLAGVTTRTLRYYDQIGLLRPIRVSNGYRIYGEAEIDRLQQILFYRELGLELRQIGAILDDPKFDREQALQGHLTALLQKRIQLELLIGNVEESLRAMKGDFTMSSKDKFKGFKEKMIQDNESRYGKEIREKYGDDTVNASYAKVRGMSEEKMADAERLSQQINQLLAETVPTGDPASERAQRVCELHRQWICLFWPDGMYSKEAHMGLADMYVADERFKAYYEKIAPGCTEFLRDAIHIYCTRG